MTGPFLLMHRDNVNGFTSVVGDWLFFLVAIGLFC